MIPGLDLWQSLLFIIVCILCINYIILMIRDRLTAHSVNISGVSSFEGFETMAESSRTEVFIDEEVYDNFYASIYNKVFQHDKLVQAEAALVLHDWTNNTKPEDMHILDLCCGTGVASCYFAKQGISKVSAVDRSAAMLRYAKSSIMPKTTLTGEQGSAIQWVQSDAYSPSIVDPGTVTHACLFYFTIYHFRDIDAIFRNLSLWVKPGGHLAVEVVNKYKFEPIPDVANPWIAVSPQKYSKERITSSKAAFDKFDYESEFNLEDPRAEFNEVFRFKDGTIRRQKHVLWMQSIAHIIARAKEAGWIYEKFTGLDMIGFNYGFMLFFVRDTS